MLERLSLRFQIGDGLLHAFGVVLDLFVETGCGFVDEMAVMAPLDEALETEGNEKTDGNGGEMDEEVAPTMNRLVGRMDFYHWVLGEIYFWVLA